jgi:hypothetical protein
MTFITDYFLAGFIAILDCFILDHTFHFAFFFACNKKMDTLPPELLENIFKHLLR